jgi:hypothetical protein
MSLTSHTGLYHRVGATSNPLPDDIRYATVKMPGGGDGEGIPTGLGWMN